MSAVQKIIAMLKLHAWRDKLFRTLVYSFNLVASRFPGTKFAARLSNFASAISTTRAYTRFFGSISAVKSAVDYGVGSKRESPAYRTLQVIQNLSDVLFYPSEHMALLCQLDIASSKDRQKWASRSTVLWALSLFCGIVRSLMMYLALHSAKARMVKAEFQIAGGLSEDAKAIDARLRLLTMTIARDFCDFMNAIHWCPGNFLWNGKLSPTQSAALGVISSVIGIRVMTLG